MDRDRNARTRPERKDTKKRTRAKNQNKRTKTRPFSLFCGTLDITGIPGLARNRIRVDLELKKAHELIKARS